MRKFLLLPLFLLCACSAYDKTIVTFPDGFKVKAEIADTPEKTEKGLMHRKTLAENKGMLFIFDKSEPRLFWMKNTLISLDIIFINSDKTIYSIAHNVPRSYVYTPDDQVRRVQGFGKYVLEVPSGTARKHNLAEGSALEFNLK